MGSKREREGTADYRSCYSYLAEQDTDGMMPELQRLREFAIA